MVNGVHCLSVFGLQFHALPTCHRSHPYIDLQPLSVKILPHGDSDGFSLWGGVYGAGWLNGKLERWSKGIDCSAIPCSSGVPGPEDATAVVFRVMPGWG